MTPVSKRSSRRRLTIGQRNTLWATLLVVVVIWAISVAQADARPMSPKRAVCAVFKARCGPAWRVVMCESRGNPRAVSRTNDVGLFQVNFSAHGWPNEDFAEFRRRMTDPIRNAAYAYRLSRAGTSWSHWKWSQHCHGLR